MHPGVSLTRRAPSLHLMTRWLSQQSIEAADLLLPNVEHEVKRIWSAERAVAALFFDVNHIDNGFRRPMAFDPC